MPATETLWRAALIALATAAFGLAFAPALGAIIWRVTSPSPTAPLLEVKQ